MLPPFARTALLLDLDGTLLDIAPTPDSVVVPDGLIDTLIALQTALGGALAIVTGRAIPVVDGFLCHPFAVAGEHGGAIRTAPGGAIDRPDLPSVPAAWIDRAEALAAAHPGAIMERKARGFAMHFRGTPASGSLFHAALTALVESAPGFQLMPGLMLWEIRPLGADKGSAVATLMAQPPFLGRLPLFIGDDVTDEDGMRVARIMGGAGLRVDAAFGSPTGVRAWLAKAAEMREWP
ncbi:MAG: trehalose-phosphatase [Rhodospirillales bacterium]